jgi:quercetin dioxygenase-like cupin family protein
MSDQTRLREHPSERFAPPEHLLDLHHEIDELRREPHKAIDGHRQKALYKFGGKTIVVFAFEANGCLKDHVVPDGSVVIQILEGVFTVKTPTAEHQMNRGHLLLLAPGIIHSVTASQTGSMLLTVQLEARP